ncbi:MAG: HU family DNA-binding protein [Planctomycetota bacterium]|jgi:nucleoid DNA-binding protein
MAKKKAAKKKKTTASVRAKTKSEVFGTIAETTELSKKQVSTVFDELAGMIKKDLGRRGPGVFTVPGLMKITVQRKPATKARKGINPFTGEPTIFKAKPARNVVKVRPLKGLKDMV